ncbi:hypothetical protein [Stenotrophomonas sp. LM091]|uniref:hypothetical protein n=1 Tax=Stenotrophomonas sp. LM091 TaxID=1904944 RepID=UPI0012EA8DB6|nr:hypothetical protein [Stenotrophomonas sp. LM091]
MTVLNVAVIGGGNIGASLAYDCALRDCLGKGSGTDETRKSVISPSLYYQQLTVADSPPETQINTPRETGNSAIFSADAGICAIRSKSKFQGPDLAGISREE